VSDGEVDELLLHEGCFKVEELPEGTIPRRDLRLLYRHIGAPSAEEMMGPWQDEDELDRRWALIQAGQAPPAS
jgi:hypothetical protein